MYEINSLLQNWRGSPTFSSCRWTQFGFRSRFFFLSFPSRIFAVCCVKSPRRQLQRKRWLRTAMVKRWTSNAWHNPPGKEKESSWQMARLVRQLAGRHGVLVLPPNFSSQRVLTLFCFFQFRRESSFQTEQWPRSAKLVRPIRPIEFSFY